MEASKILIDAFGRVKEVVHSVLEGMGENDLAYRPGDDANSIAWLVWHLTRIQDDHMSELADHEQTWTSGDWFDKFGLPFGKKSTGYGHNSEDVAQVKASAKLLLDYYDETHAKSVAFLKTLESEDYEKIVDTRWDPPVTMAVRIVSVIEDDLQHCGQAAYVRGLLGK